MVWPIHCGRRSVSETPSLIPISCDENGGQTMGSSHDRETLEPGDIQKNEGSVHTNTRSAVSTYTACGIQHMANIILLPPLTFGFLVITWLDVFGLHSPPILAKSPRTRVFDLAYNVPTSSPQDSQLTGRESHVFILSTCHHHHHVSLFFISVFSNHVRYPSVFFFFPQAVALSSKFSSSVSFLDYVPTT